MTDFTVSPPDLTGFSEQISSLGDFYSSVGDEAAELSVGLSFMPVPMASNGQLSGVLPLFLDDFAALVTAERDAARRLAAGLGDTGQALAEVASVYREQDDAAKRRIEKAGSSAEDEAIDAAIEEGEPNFDWRSRLSGDDVFADIDFEPPTMTYKGQFEEHNASLTAMGGLTMSIDLMIESAFGFSILKGITTPLLGNWGFLYVMRDICAAEANAFETARTALANGSSTLVGDNWSGDAANAFAGHVEAVRAPIAIQVANLRRASTMFHDMGETLDQAGTDIAMLIAKVIDMVLGRFVPYLTEVLKVKDFVSFVSAGAAAWNSIHDDAWTAIKNELNGLVKLLLNAVEGLIRAIGAAATSTQGLCNELNALEPPAMNSDVAGGTPPEEPEGLTEEEKEHEPEGLTEEPNEPAGLTEEQNNGSGSEEPAAGGQQSQY